MDTVISTITEVYLYANRSSHVIVKQCINHAMYDSNYDLCYKFAFYRYTYNIDVVFWHNEQ